MNALSLFEIAPASLCMFHCDEQYWRCHTAMKTVLAWVNHNSQLDIGRRPQCHCGGARGVECGDLIRCHPEQCSETIMLKKQSAQVI
jgi:hypothetical protein